MLVLAHEILGIVMVRTDARLHHTLNLISMAIVWHHKVVWIDLVVDHRDVMIANHVWRLLNNTLMLVVIPVRMLHVRINAHRVFWWGRKRLTLVMVVHGELVDELRPLLVCVLQVVLVILKQA